MQNTTATAQAQLDAILGLDRTIEDRAADFARVAERAEAAAARELGRARELLEAGDLDGADAAALRAQSRLADARHYGERSADLWVQALMFG
ncbi:hypothetical protein BH760_gp76 [Gordonia phage Splinter]|uniref:Uncharacterized protein n=2 Tax=Vendettavirus vendetta TaxID=2049886 RepID=A0A160DD44_9CAUD|nr:hypothetical protein BH795_gp76 [Gordonia phage Vendetta]YP_009275389.1 hypothetical protein BH760_gp76 [Gordonia phage Splinter]ANA85582.1 hypothetical protein PBI_VENDETTA_35 [Gordonia phage Vendetta]ANA85661.1 hypothetical protein PBI_SPLINTER_35 [Gordonia phage Splinter]